MSGEYAHRIGGVASGVRWGCGGGGAGLAATGVRRSALLGLLFAPGGLALFVLGCWSYAVGKGYPGVWGFLRLLSLIGLITLVCFLDKHK